jgi:hypothetical protein
MKYKGEIKTTNNSQEYPNSTNDMMASDIMSKILHGDD